MNQEVKRLWIKELMAHTEVQCNHDLSIMHGETQYFCAVGVLVEAYRKHTGNGAWEPPLVPGYGKVSFRYWTLGRLEKSEYSVPEEVLYWAGISDIRDPLLNHVVKMNDTESSFSEIAEYLSTHA